MINSDNVLREISSASGMVSSPQVRSMLIALENEIKSMPQADIPTAHLFAGNIYARGILIPAGTVLTGRMYLDDHIDLMVYGDMTVTSDGESKRVGGFNLLSGNAGKKRAGFAHADTFWITFCACDEMTEEYYMSSLTIEDCDKYDQTLIRRKIISEDIIKDAYKSGDYEAFKNGYLAASGKLTKQQADREDFVLMAKEIGITPEQIRQESEIDTDMSDFNVDGVSLDKSDIQGMGLFTESSYGAGSDIMLARIDGLRTIAGRYTNHSITPNAKFVLTGDNVMLKASKSIDNEEITIDYRESFKLRGEPCQA